MARVLPTSLTKIPPAHPLQHPPNFPSPPTPGSFTKITAVGWCEAKLSGLIRITFRHPTQFLFHFPQDLHICYQLLI